MRAFSWAALGLAILVAAPACGLRTGGAASPASGPGVVFLVRHAETAPDGTRDPALSAEGRSRADRLADALTDAGLTAVLTTDYRRTRSTAGPVAERLGLAPALYDPALLQDLARDLKARGGRVLVVGHSNTTPALVAALGGEPGPPIAEDEHDRLYVLVPDGDGTRTVLLRY